MKLEHKPHILRVPDAESLSYEALDIFIEAASQSIRARGVFYVAISGGATPGHFYELLGSQEKSKKLDWKKIHVFWADERCVSASSEQSNFHLASEAFLKHVPIPQDNIHRIIGEERDPRTAAREYADEIREVFHIQRGEIPEFDLIALGMGADGHTASLFPDSFAPFEIDDLATAVFMLDDKLNRVTLTTPVLTGAKQILVLVSGPDKAETIAHVLANEPDVVKFPVQVLWPVLDKVTWLIDEPAAAQLPADLE